MNKDLQKRIIFTICLLVIARMGVFIPIPGVDHDALYAASKNNQFISFLNMFSGGGFSTIGLFALGIVPFINSSIVIQILVKVIPSLEKLQQEEGESGRQQINQITRSFSFGWAIIQSLSISFWIRPYVFDWNISFIADTVLSLTTGSMLVMWLSELITEKGIGNGTSLLIFFNVISNLPKDNIQNFILTANFNLALLVKLIFLIILFIIMVLLAILMQETMKKLNIVSARQLNDFSTSRDSRLNSYIPLKLYQGGVMPIIFASAVISLLIYILQIFQSEMVQYFISLFLPKGILYLPLYAVLIFVFSYLYSSLIFNPYDISKNLRKAGSSIVGIRPGQDTISYLKTVLNRLTFLGSILLFIIAVLPSFISFINIDFVRSISPTSILILVGVAIQTTKQVQTYMMTSEYEEMTKAK
uniref:preprotein translocase subunit SecY n=1 Tax=Porphyridium aerugineum TaxID=2792 RepID=UPI001FCDC8FC|nr:preprotein translocase subunit SecY [Porphyridium aerugineum]UNJ17993.1 preprotein translocase subunit SecY [Porphyridium aerugineum]